MEQHAEAFQFLPFPLAYAPEGHDIKREPPPTPHAVPAAAEQSFGSALPPTCYFPVSHVSLLGPDVQHPTDEDLLYAAMLLNDQPLEETLLEDGSMLHLADATSFSDAERERSVTRQVCAAAGCTLLCRPRGRLCVKHQKQRERGRQPFELKDPNIVLSKGRPPLPFSKSNKRKKLQRLDQLLTELGGGKEEGTLYLQTYLESDFWKARNTANVHDHSRLFSLVGRMLLSEVPPMHPLRAQLNALFTEEQIKEAMLASEVARSHAAQLPFTDGEQVPEQLL